MPFAAPIQTAVANDFSEPLFSLPASARSRFCLTHAWRLSCSRHPAPVPENSCFATLRFFSSTSDGLPLMFQTALVWVLVSSCSSAGELLHHGFRLAISPGFCPNTTCSKIVLEAFRAALCCWAVACFHRMLRHSSCCSTLIHGYFQGLHMAAANFLLCSFFLPAVSWQQLFPRVRFAASFLTLSSLPDG